MADDAHCRHLLQIYEEKKRHAEECDALRGAKAYLVETQYRRHQAAAHRYQAARDAMEAARAAHERELHERYEEEQQEKRELEDCVRQSETANHDFERAERDKREAQYRLNHECPDYHQY